MHLTGYVHGDVKPENIVVRVAEGEEVTEDAVFLVDFDCCTFWSPDRFVKSHPGMGTRYYRAPELARSGEDVTPKADAYSVAATLLALLKGLDWHSEVWPDGAAYPPLLDTFTDKLSPLAIDFFKVGLCFDPSARASVLDLYNHPFLHADPSVAAPGAAGGGGAAGSKRMRSVDVDAPGAKAARS
jgi:serine/threonine protein kinase